MLHAVIMAGGSGTRFWPASRKRRPKQLLKLSGDRSMIQSTIDRLGDLVPPERQIIVTNKILVDPIAEQLPQLSLDKIIGEPCKRDTAPCIGLAASLVQNDDPDAIMAVMPSDHVISSHQAFQDAISLGEKLVLEDPERIVTFGIKPSYPAESFGYIQRDSKIDTNVGLAFTVRQFREKPNRTTAEEYVSSGAYYWNSGIFLWKAATILDALKKNEPRIVEHLEKIATAIGTDAYDDVLEQEFSAIVGKSIDYAVMENYPNVVMIEAEFSWDDLGSWQALSRLHHPDADGNTVIGSHIGIDTRGCIVHGEKDHTIVTIDAQDLIVVQTPDATLVAPKHAEERVREAVKALQDRGLDVHL